MRGQGSHLGFIIASKDITVLQDPQRNICGKFGDWAYSGSEEEIKNVYDIWTPDTSI